MGLNIERKLPTLVVDDKRDISGLVKTVLDTEGGYFVFTVDDPQQALDAAKTVRFYLVITDLYMLEPGDGMKLIGELTRLSYASRMRIILMTATPELLTAADLALLQERQGEVLPKPFDINRLLGMTERVREEF